MDFELGLYLGEIFCEIISTTNAALFYISNINIDLKTIGVFMGLYYFFYNTRISQKIRTSSLITNCIKDINESAFDVFYSADDKILRDRSKGVVDTNISNLEMYIAIFPTWFGKDKKKIQELYQEYIDSIKLDTGFESDKPVIHEAEKCREIMEEIYSRSVYLSRKVEECIKIHK